MSKKQFFFKLVKLTLFEIYYMTLKNDDIAERKIILNTSKIRQNIRRNYITMYLWRV